MICLSSVHGLWDLDPYNYHMNTIHQSSPIDHLFFKALEASASCHLSKVGLYLNIATPKKIKIKENNSAAP